MKIRNKTLLRSTSAGFSLAELMVVIVIIGLLVTIVVPNVIQRLGFAQRSTAQANITAIADALGQYAIMNGNRYPDSLEELVTPDENGNTFLNMRKLPKDPWGNDYMYEPPNPPAETRPRVYSYGKDGMPAGEGENADIDNFQEDDE